MEESLCFSGNQQSLSRMWRKNPRTDCIHSMCVCVAMFMLCYVSVDISCDVMSCHVMSCHLMLCYVMLLYYIMLFDAMQRSARQGKAIQCQNTLWHLLSPSPQRLRGSWSTGAIVQRLTSGCPIPPNHKHFQPYPMQVVGVHFLSLKNPVDGFWSQHFLRSKICSSRWTTCPQQLAVGEAKGKRREWNDQENV